ncbi:MAG: hypothetical protein ACJ8FI_08560 [Sphingomicrobium sp.]
MDDEAIAKIRDRMARIRAIANMTHNPEMTAMLLKIADEGEAEAARLEDQQAAAKITMGMPPPQQP